MNIATLPNLLTFSRILLIPVIIVAFYFDSPYSNWITFCLFAYAGITDYLDGKIARTWKATTVLGQLLDPIADKMLVTAVLFMLVVSGLIHGSLIVPSLIILLREILISGLREFLSYIGKSLPVSPLAKWKTATQFIAISILLLGNTLQPIPATLIGGVLLWISAIITLATGYSYILLATKYYVKGSNHIDSSN